MSITLWQYYLNLAARIADSAFDGINSLSDWQSRRDELHRRFRRSMGLDPLPPRCDPNVTEFGEFSGQGYRAKKLAWQILPDCWATGCVYYPDPLPAGRLPAVLYASGHHAIGIVGYQDHAVMWAGRGYICLVFDTIEQHDNPGEHHGLYSMARYDWISMGYTGAGGELWNSMRALDVLTGLPEVDVARIGVTGNSGGGAHSFFLAVADDRIKAVATSCGVAVPKQTLADRHLLGHCDCMYYHNPHQKDTSEFAALIAPRAALFCFASEDTLFSRNEYQSLVERTKKVYRLFDCADKCALFEYPGPHGYQPESVAAINKWFDKHVAGKEHPEIERGKPEHEEKVITVFNGRPPSPDRLDLLPELLSPQGSIELPRNADDWPAIRESATESLRKEVFHLLDEMDESLEVEELGNWFTSERRDIKYRGRLGGMDLMIEALVQPHDDARVVVGLADGTENVDDVLRRVRDHVEGHTIIAVEPRGSGFSSCHPNQERHLLRAGALTGLTPAMLLIHDLHHVMRFVTDLPFVKGRRIYLYGRADAGVACLYHGVLDDEIAGVVAQDITATHRRGAYILGILRVLDLPEAVGLMAPRPVGLVNQSPSRTTWAARSYERLGCPERLIARSHSLKVVFDKVLGVRM